MTTFTLFYCLSCAGAAVPFALNNQLVEGGLFNTKPFNCHTCLSFWLAAVGLILINPSQVVFAGLAPLAALAIHKLFTS
jgi:hypothetical protein